MLGTVKREPGVLFEGPNFVTVKKVGVKGDVIGRHNHPEAYVVFTVLKGNLTVLLDGSEEHKVAAGDALNFDGDHTIQATFETDGEVLVNLIHKK